MIIFSESLAVTYLGRNDLSHVDTDEITSKASRGIVKKLSEPEFESEEVISERVVELDKDHPENYTFTPGSKGTVTKERSTQTINQMTTKVKQAIENGYTGDICPECQSITMVRNGTCLKCMTCGSTTGCS